MRAFPGRNYTARPVYRTMAGIAVAKAKYFSCKCLCMIQDVAYLQCIINHMFKCRVNDTDSLGIPQSHK